MQRLSPWGRQQEIKAPAVMRVLFSFQPLRETARAFLFRTCFARASTGNWRCLRQGHVACDGNLVFEQNSRRIRASRTDGGCEKRSSSLRARICR